MRLSIILFIFLCFFVILPAYAQSSDKTLDKTTPKTESLYLFGATFVLGVILNLVLISSKKLQSIRKKRNVELEKGFLIKSPYDNLDVSEFEKLSSKLSLNYTVLISIYAVLFAFIVSDKAGYAFSSWYFVIWCGWILAIIVKAGIIMNSLFDISDKSSKKETSRQIYAAREFFKHSLYLLIPTVAFLPTFFLISTPSLQIIQELPWAMEESMMLAAISIVALFFTFYQFPLRIREFTKKGGTKDAYTVVILLMIFGVLAGYANSPLDPIEFISDKTNEIIQIPAIIYAIGIGGMGYFVIMITIFYNLLPKKIRDIFSSENQTKRKNNQDDKQ